MLEREKKRDREVKKKKDRESVLKSERYRDRDRKTERVFIGEYAGNKEKEKGMRKKYKLIYNKRQNSYSSHSP